MISKLRQKFVLITMSLLVAVVSLLLMINSYRENFWNNYDTYRLARVIADNGYLKESMGESVAVVSFDENGQTSIDLNETDLTTQEVQHVSQKLKKQGKKNWKWSHYVYALKARKNGTWQLAFIDLRSYSLTFEQRLFYTLFGIFGLLLLLGISLYLSRFIVRPVQTALDREKQFVSDASHELKTPIAAIRANAQVLQNQIEPNRYLEHVLSETKRMEHLVQDLLGLSKLDDSSKREKMEPVDLSGLCEKLVLSYESLAFEEGKLMAAKIAEGVTVKGYSVQLQQLVTILLDNAIKHSLPNSVIHIQLTQQKRQAVLTVSNPSPAYSQDIMGNLFERFYQAECSRHSSSSFGLGLSIAKAIVQQHKGTITAKQADDVMTFEVHLPSH